MITNKSYGITNFGLKIIAIVCMFIDHVGSIFQENVGSFYTPMRIVGRLAFPIFCYLIVEGFVHTRDRWRYAFRLGLFCLMSEPCFDLAFHNTLWYKDKQNVFFTLLIGLLVIWCVDRIKETFVKNWYFCILKVLLSATVIGTGCYLANWLMTDYSYRGILFICIFYLLRDRMWLGMGLFAIVNLICGFRLTVIDIYGWGIGKEYLTNFFVQDAAILAIFPMILYNGQKGRSIKWFFYLFYPVHLMLLYLIAEWRIL